MRVLVACEFSGVVREAFRRRGHEAWSCDLLPADDGSEHHYEGDVRWLLDGEKPHWDLLIAHPPCTFLCNSGVRWLYGGKGIVPDAARWKSMNEAADLFKWLYYDSGVQHVALENPIMHRHALDAIFCHRPERFERQIVHPWQFGHPETKATALWLRNLPLLQPTNIVEGRQPRVHHESPGPDRWKRRSITYQGIADAMADQWGTALLRGGRPKETT